MNSSILWMLTFIGCKSCSENEIIEKGQVTETAEPEEVFTNDWGSWLSMSGLSDGKPIVSYYDKTEGGLGVAIADTSSDPVTWEHQEVDGYKNDQGLDVGNHGKFSALAVSSNDTIWIAHYDVGLRTLRYATKTTTDAEWTIGVADTGGGSSPDAGWFASIALDDSEFPVIAHHDYVKKTLRIARWDGSSFTGEVVDTGEDASDESGETVDANVGQFTAIAIDSGTEYITYYDAAHGSLKLAYGTSGNYTFETLDQGNVGQWSSINIVDGILHITYHDVENQDLKYITGTPGSFAIETIDDGEIVGADSDIYVNEDELTVVYFDGKNNNIKKAVRSGDTWTTSTLAGDDGALGFHNEIASIGGTLYAACYNYGGQTVWFEAID
jgi:hypothetical protein